MFPETMFSISICCCLEKYDCQEPCDNIVLLIASSQGWQSVGSIRFPDPGPTEISRTWSCSDLDIHFNGRIRIESSLQLLKYRSYCSVLYVYPEKVGRRIE